MATWTPRPFRRLSGVSRPGGGLTEIRICLDLVPPTEQPPLSIRVAGASCRVPPSPSAVHRCRNFAPARHRLRPLTLRGLGLGSDSPWDVCRCPGTLRLPVWRVSITAIHATHSGIRACGRSTSPPGLASPLPTTLPYHVAWTLAPSASAASGDCLSPGTLSAQGHSTSELLRTLSRMAASKPTSWLSARPHHLSHSAASWGP